jgi:hypothetical protein
MRAVSILNCSVILYCSFLTANHLYGSSAHPCCNVHQSRCLEYGGWSIRLKKQLAVDIVDGYFVPLVHILFQEA